MVVMRVQMYMIMMCCRGRYSTIYRGWLLTLLTAATFSASASSTACTDIIVTIAVVVRRYVGYHSTVLVELDATRKGARSRRWWDRATGIYITLLVVRVLF